MKANKKHEELRNVKTKSQGGRKMRKKKTIIKKNSKKNKVVNILKESVSFSEFLFRRNERLVRQDEEEVELPKHPCITCRFFVNGRCAKLGRPITEPLTTKCFKHSSYPQEEQVYLAFEQAEADIFEIFVKENLGNVS